MAEHKGVKAGVQGDTNLVGFLGTNRISPWLLMAGRGSRGKRVSVEMEGAAKERGTEKHDEAESIYLREIDERSRRMSVRFRKEGKGTGRRTVS